MADIAARREARRRRILENSENRLQKITGKTQESPVNDDDGKNPTKSNFINGFILPKSIATEEITSQTKNFEHQDENVLSKEQLQEDNDVTHCNIYNEYNLKDVGNETKEKRTNLDNLKFNSSSTSFSEKSNAKLPQDIYLYNMFFSPISLLILAACLNILVLMDVNFSVYMGIIMPYTILVTTQLCLGKSQDTQGSSMLIAALVLCNVKTEVVHTFKTLYVHLDIIVKNFALYITSFIFINWIITTFFYNSRQIQFL